MDISNISALTMVAGAPFSQVYGYMNVDDTPVDLTGWVGVAVFYRDKTQVLSKALTLAADGTVTLDLSAEQVNQITGPRITVQFNLTPADFDAPTEVWRGAVVVQ